ncbi:hypothetical protein RSA28_09455, partial [Rothia kristinae]
MGFADRRGRCRRSPRPALPPVRPTPGLRGRRRHGAVRRRSVQQRPVRRRDGRRKGTCDGRRLGRRARRRLPRRHGAGRPGGRTGR